MASQPHSLSGLPGVVLANGGSSALSTANSRTALTIAIESGAGVKSDWRLTSDGKLIIASELLTRRLVVETSAYARLAELDPELVTVSWLLHRAPPESVVVGELKYGDVPAGHGPIENAVLAELAEVERVGGATTAISSFSPGALLELHRLAPELTLLQVFDGLPTSPDVQMINEVLELVRQYASGIVPDVRDLMRFALDPWVSPAHAKGLGVFPYPPRSMTKVAEQRAGIQAMIAAGSDGGHFNLPAMYGQVLGTDVPTPAEAMRAFLEARRAFPATRRRVRDLHGRLAARMITLGGGPNMSVPDVRAAIKFASRKQGDVNVVARCEELLSTRQ
jgi:glycerophosphoryl diester phosphodiesterase